MNIPGFTAESSIGASSNYRLAARHDWGEQTVRAQVNCLGCANYSTQECEDLPPHLLGPCYRFYYNRCCHGIRD
jgi:hypothetical protein